MRILWVENHSSFIRVVARQFLGGHELTIVPSLRAARAAIETGAFDAALVDYDLDDGKGDELVLELRRGFPRLAIIATSSHEEGNRALMAAGADVICGKLEFDGISQVLEELGKRDLGDAKK